MVEIIDMCSSSEVSVAVSPVRETGGFWVRASASSANDFSGVLVMSRHVVGISNMAGI